MMDSVRKLLGKLADIVFVSDEQVRQLPKIDKPCPRCKQETLRKSESLAFEVHRCTNCRFEGATSKL